MPATDPRTPELAVVLACARSRRNPEITHQVRTACEAPLDWSLVMRMAYGHGLTALLHWQLSQCAEVVPPAVLDETRDRFQRNAARNVSLTVELHRILDLLATHRMTAIPYKGPALAQLAYGDLGLRQFIDLDILLRKCDVRPARELMEILGYRPQLSLTTAQESALVDSHCEYALQRARDGSCVELHWEIVPPEFGLPVKTWRIWGRRPAHAAARDDGPLSSARGPPPHPLRPRQ